MTILEPVEQFRMKGIYSHGLESLKTTFHLYDFESPNVPQNKLVCSGIPIRQVFYQRGDAVEAKQAAGVSEELPHLLMMCGSMGCGPIKRLVHLLSQEDGFELTVVCGTNQKLFHKLDRRYARYPNIHIRWYEKICRG